MANRKATISGSLQPIDNCKLVIPSENPAAGTSKTLVMNNLPDISDSKQAHYNNEGIIGRAAPLYTYSHSGDRNINIQFHFFITREACDNLDCNQCGNCNLDTLRWIQSATYPRTGLGTPYRPPPICKFTCGSFLSKDGYICIALQSYNVKFPTEVAWDEGSNCPYRFDVDTSWLIVYDTANLPFQSRIYETGY